MSHIRNFTFFIVFAFMVTGCGGGDTTISANGTSGTGSTSGVSNPGGTGGTNVTTGTLTLRWTAPTTWTDGSALSLSEISGYRVYYGTSSTGALNSVRINDGSATQYQITLPTGSYYFRISTVSSNGVEGPMTASVQATI